LAIGFLVLPAAWAQLPGSIAKQSLPDAPIARTVATVETAQLSAVVELPNETTPGQSATSPASAQQTTQTPPVVIAPDKQAPVEQPKSSEEQLKIEEHQRILGVMPAFNSVNSGVAVPLTPGQKFRLMFKSTTDPYVFGFAAFTAGIGQAQNSHADYGQGMSGYAARFGANYVDTADGNLWGNAILPVVLHQDPRYFRLGHGTFKRRLLYSMSTSVMCKSDRGKWQPNYSNILGNLIAGGISNVYYPAEDRGAAQTFQNAATVTAEGMIGAVLIEFWPDIAAHYRRKHQEKMDAAAAAARNSQTAHTTGLPPQ
jgi:hypothetical protein